MIIAAHFFGTRQQASQLSSCFQIIATQQPDDLFIFFTDNLQETSLIVPANCQVVQVSPSINNGLLMHYWYNFKLPYLLKKFNAGVFISETGACSLRTKTVQCMYIKQIAFLAKKNNSEAYSRYIKKFFSRFVKRAEALLVAEHFMKTLLVEKYPALIQKISFAGHQLPVEYDPLEPEQKIQGQESYTEGFEYFICECSPRSKQHIISILKAYSIFKKRLKTNMRLVCLLSDITAEECIPDLKNYKYRKDLSFFSTQQDKDISRLVGCAYAMLYLGAETSTSNMGLYAMKCGVPVITGDSRDTRSVYQEAALFTGVTDQLIADQMMLLYKDENLRKEQIRKGNELAANYSAKLVADTVWQTILKISKD